MITVYTKDKCPACVSVKYALQKRNVEFETVDITHDKAKQEELQSRGHRTMPVVVTDADEWAGYLPHKINEVAG